MAVYRRGKGRGRRAGITGTRTCRLLKMILDMNTVLVLVLVLVTVLELVLELFG